MGSGSSGCPGSLTDCSGNCLDTLNNPSYCGDCETPCAQDEYCDNGTCTSKYIPNCDDGNPCTDDLYDIQAQSCVYSNNTVPCDDGNLCTENDTCSAGICQGASKDCGDDNICTDDSCDPQTGSCMNSNNTAACDDNISCTKNDQCVSGTCTGVSYYCDDGLTCTADVCDGNGGCTSTPLADFCSISGTCYSDGATNPTNECQICDVLASQYSWSNKSVGTACGDSTDSECTDPDTCSGSGTCLPNDTPVGTACGDPTNNECTDPDTCSGSGTCLPNDASPGTACTGGTCSDGICI